MTEQAKAVEAARAHREASGAGILAEFLELLNLPNVSRNLDDVGHVAEHIVAMLTSRQIEARLEELPGAAPLVVGHLRVPGATTTIGIYAHYDGQPIDQPDWSVEPFKPSLFDDSIADGGREIPPPHDGDDIDPEWRIYARSTSDDKAPVMAVCAALDGMRKAGASPASNIVFLFEGEEEIGSPHLATYLARLQEELAADVWLICDGPVHQSRRPQVVFGVRGISEMEITAHGPI
ncbi:MAG: M20/M25/M40 family metallo-hydrolase, partial [Acidimicrobiia bacterium]|nr:M20/M25/M40 family metallo-hydrolase [Acidimicrobiia bacterium]